MGHHGSSFWERPAASAIAATISLWLIQKALLVSGQQFTNTWAYSDMFINYSGGFVRRGLIGHLLTLWHQQTGGSGATPIALVYTLAAISLAVSFVALAFKGSPSAWIAFVIVLSPATLLFPIWDIGAYLRKEVFVLALSALLSAIFVFAPGVRNAFSIGQAMMFCFVFGLLFAITVLVWEPSFLLVGIFFLWFSRIVSRVQVRPVLGSLSLSRFLIATLALSPAAFAFAMSVRNPGDPGRSIRNLADVQEWSYAPAWAISFHGLPSSSHFELTNSIWSNPVAITGYVITFLLGPVFLSFLLIYFGHLKGWLIACVALTPTLVLFVIAVDYGRWIHIVTMSLIVYLISLPRQIVKPSLASRSSNARLSRFALIAVLGVFVIAYVSLWRLPHFGAQPLTAFLRVPSVIVVHLPDL